MRLVWHVFSLSLRGNMAAESYASLQITVTAPHDTGRIIREKQMEALIHYLFI